MSDPIVIVSVARTPVGSMQGELSGFTGHELGSHAIKAAVERAGLKPEQIQEVIMGCVLPAGQGQAPARQAVLGAGLPTHVSPHMLRHSYASHLLQSSGDLRAVQELLGHANITTTQVYTKLDFQHLAKVYDAAHPRAKKKLEKGTA